MNPTPSLGGQAWHERAALSPVRSAATRLSRMAGTPDRPPRWGDTSSPAAGWFGGPPSAQTGAAGGTSGQNVMGFTLIELMVVISVIGILATLILSVTSSAALKNKLSRVKIELSQCETAIDAYKAKFGNYPPDHVAKRDSNGQPLIVNPEINQLYYELTGTTVTNNGFVSALDQEVIPQRLVQRVFGIQAFLNVGEEGQPPKNFLPSLKASQYGIWNTNTTLRLLTVSVPWTANSPTPPIPKTLLNPVRYVSSRPTNNPTTFDLWAEVPVGKRIYVLGNWNEYVPAVKQP